MRFKSNILSAIFSAFVLGITAYSTRAQDMQDSTLSFPIIGFQYSFDIPFGTLAKSFGGNSTVGAAFWRKTKYNVLFGIEYNYIFGDAVKVNPLDSIVTTSGFLVDNAGQWAQDVQVFERGHFAMLKAGKIIRGVGPNPNCGITLMGGAGFWYHQVYYFWNGDQPPAVTGNYLNGYERVTYGPALSESVGYMNFSNNKRINFSVSLEAAQGFTREVDYEYDLRKSDNTTHFDMTLGIKVDWYFPIYNRVKEKYYY